jgi:cell division protein FtsZ
MTFITAGMGGGTGTGAAPVIARVSKELDILTVGIVTIPFRFEGKKKINQALDGVEEMAKHVDALLVINNERLRKIYPELTVLDAFGKADDTLSVAAKSIAEIITNHGLINLDFNDVKTVLKDGGVAIMSTGYGEGEGRVKQAIQDALNSPLLNDNDIFNSKKILLSINFSKDSNKDNPAAGGLMMEEMNEVNDFMEQFGSDFEIKWGIGLDPDLGNKVKVTILATGFGIRDVDGMDSHIKKIVQEKDEKATEEEIQQGIRMGMYYPDGTGKFVVKRRPHIFRFQSDDLDNEEVILAIENTPTYKRTQQQVKELRRRLTDEREVVKQKADEGVVRTITF